MKKIILHLTFLLTLPLGQGLAQNIAINTDGTPAETGRILDIKGTNAIGTTASQTVFQLKSFNTDATALKLQMILGTHATASSRWAGLEVYDAGAAAYRNLSFQPNGGNVGIGTTAPSNKLAVMGGNVAWGSSSEVNLLQNDQGGSIELGGTNSLANPAAGGMPYIDFHYGTGGVQDYNTRIINDANGRLNLLGTIRINNVYNLPAADGTSGQILSTNGAGNLFWTSSVPNTLSKITSVSLTNASSYNITGLNGNVNEMYIIILSGQFNTGGVSRVIYLQPNGDGTNANYNYMTRAFWQWYGGNGWNYGSYDVPGIGLMEMTGTNQYIYMNTSLLAKTGSYRNATTTVSYQSPSTRDAGVEVSDGAWKNTASNITSINVVFGGGTFTGNLIVYTIQ